MYNRRVSKNHPRVHACGSVDELNAALGMVRAVATDTLVKETVALVQKDLIVFMGELATAPGDLERYVRDGFSLVTAEMTKPLDQVVQAIESRKISFKGWATPGANLERGHLGRGADHVSKSRAGGLRAKRSRRDQQFRIACLFESSVRCPLAFGTVDGTAVRRGE